MFAQPTNVHLPHERLIEGQRSLLPPVCRSKGKLNPMKYYRQRFAAGSEWSNAIRVKAEL
jgi:hypothetical protein